MAPPEQTEQTPRQPPEHRLHGEPVPLAEAARRLGLTSEAVRMRLKRGTLAGEKVDGRWVAFLPPAQPEADTYTAHLEAEIAHLREQLATRDAELERRDVLLREALARIPPALPPGTPDAPQTHPAASGRAPATQTATWSEPRSRRSRPWWRWLLGLP